MEVRKSERHRRKSEQNKTTNENEKHYDIIKIKHIIR